MTPIIDTHCHLADPRLDGELEAILARAAEAGVARIIAVGAIGPIEHDRRTVEIAERHANIHAVVGVHPHDASECTTERISMLRTLARSSKVAAIGESGLDFHYLRSPVDAQERALRDHLRLARETRKPIVIHSRDAEERLAAIVTEEGLGPEGGVIHCFTGDTTAARRFLDLGFYISFSGILTFRNAGALRDAARVVPRDRLMVETDAPYLAPEPLRGKRNEPAFVRRTLEVLAQTRGDGLDTLAASIRENARRLFRLPD
jgi:TatD DNase family protein